MSRDEVAFGFIKVANETVTRPIRSLTEAKGHDTSKHRLATFGGAGGQHAVAMAESLGIRQILIHRYSSVLSAYGMALADVVDENQEPESKTWADDDKGGVQDALGSRIEDLKKRPTQRLQDQGFGNDSIVFEEYLNMRYRGTESALMILKPSKEEADLHFRGDEWAFGKAFARQHDQEFGLTLPDRDIIVHDVRVRGIGKRFKLSEKTVAQKIQESNPKDVTTGQEYRRSFVYFEGGRRETPIYKLKDLKVDERTHIVINIGESDASLPKVGTDNVDPILLSVFPHRFMAIAEQMGRSLQKTSVSTNVKERLDYSCALFDAEGGLVANAPDLPVHLGSMSTCVRIQARIWQDKLKPGDVIVSNHPEFGGTHLPDITVLQPAFSQGKIIFYVASRAHHGKTFGVKEEGEWNRYTNLHEADIGGILPGSMPPHSKELYEEGAAIKGEKLVSEGKFDGERITELLYKEPAQYPTCSGT
ncbi:unnamed protein product [Penicillium egyptiacum]|uniref:Hydantoinase B/oxoprolinase domain-containing protein n=1 Tax=Penicillium egyptiacum TaxID=1303716 RepID=A0A9W4K5K5_9EURO|nr:unnamed protein product [Penicillium egyptiacum]